jgi:hypothetical protein
MFTNVAPTIMLLRTNVHTVYLCVSGVDRDRLDAYPDPDPIPQILPRCHNFQYSKGVIKLILLKKIRIWIQIGRPGVPIKIRQNDTDPTRSGSESTTLLSVLCAMIRIYYCTCYVCGFFQY